MSNQNSVSYIICAAPRTGSTLLAQALGSIGTAGKPNEFFDIHDYNDRFWKERLGVADEAEYFDKAVAAGTGANGVFALKLLWHQSPALLAKLRAAGAAPADADESVLHALLTARLGAPPRYIWLRRSDKLAQAISYLRASKTGLWRSTDVAENTASETDADLDFDFDLIAQYVRVVSDFDQRWQAYFRHNRLKVLAITYENFIAAYEATVFSALDFLGIAKDGIRLPPPRLQRQADQRSREWHKRFLDIAAERGMIQQRSRAKSAASEPVEGAAAEGAAAETPRSEQVPARRARPVAATPAEPPLPLIAYQLGPQAMPLVKAGGTRDWMDATAVRFAYRCLPMVIANQHGWLLLNKHKIAVTWNGGPDPAALRIDFLGGDEPRNAVSLFGGGILTFTVGYLFRTPPGWNLYVRGPANSPKDGVTALEGIIESDWTEGTFTMNWKITRPNHPLVFEAGEPIAMISPVKRGEVERFRPELHAITEDPELAALHLEWARSRQKHNADLKIPDSQARKNGWQRHYVRGISIRNEPADQHQTKLAVVDFVDKRR
ncbi:MAG TPA: DUF6065 family protein [Stellaceae bacterium]|jgi:LPS sulfotransferase NodH|nr:DUF6065 family protein [Stellaceae bacterium]